MGFLDWLRGADDPAPGAVREVRPYPVQGADVPYATHEIYNAETGRWVPGCIERWGGRDHVTTVLFYGTEDE